MKPGIAAVLILVLIGCEYEGIKPSDAVAVREIHYNFETGERVGTKTFAYDASNNLLYERFVDELKDDYQTDFEVIYERDGQGRQITRRERYPEVNSQYFVQETTYRGSLKISEKDYYTDRTDHFEQRFFYYTGSVLDSLVRTYTTPAQANQRMNSETYKYDSEGRLTEVHLTRSNFAIRMSMRTARSRNACLIFAQSPNTTRPARSQRSAKKITTTRHG